MLYQIYFRTSRGGIGIPYDLAKLEFLTVFDPVAGHITREWWAKHRMWIHLDASPAEVAALAPDLGYTEGILHLQPEPYQGEDLQPVGRGRWYTGWIREQDQKIYQTEVYVQDTDALLAEAPNNRTFEIREDSGQREAVGHRAHRALSPLDARFILNVAQPRPTDRILDPFAGYGGLVHEAVRRGLTITASDIDPLLSPGLADLDPHAYIVADARDLPCQTSHFDLIVGEPPFRTTYREAALDALPELLRVLKPEGRLILLIETGMRADVHARVNQIGSTLETIGTIPRNGGVKSPLLRIVK